MIERNMAVEIAGVRFKNPVIAASGCFGFGQEYARYYDLSLLGGISVKGLTLERREGNAPARIAETASGMLNSVGLQNPGIEAFIEKELTNLERADTAIIANVAGRTIDEYRAMVRRLRDVPVDMVELNISCPNVKQGGVAFGVYPENVEEVVSAVRKECRQPLMVKLSPNTADIVQTALAAERAGADALSLINTITGMAIDAETRRPVLANITGGLSGPAVKPVALRMVYQVTNAVKIPVVGMGGIMKGSDVVEFLLAGARAVMVGTANLLDPMACPRIINELESYMERHNVEDVNSLVGGLMIRQN